MATVTSSLVETKGRFLIIFDVLYVNLQCLATAILHVKNACQNARPGSGPTSLRGGIPIYTVIYYLFPSVYFHPYRVMYIYTQILYEILQTFYRFPQESNRIPQYSYRILWIPYRILIVLLRISYGFKWTSYDFPMFPPMVSPMFSMLFIWFYMVSHGILHSF